MRSWATTGNPFASTCSDSASECKIRVRYRNVRCVHRVCCPCRWLTGVGAEWLPATPDVPTHNRECVANRAFTTRRVTPHDCVHSWHCRRRRWHRRVTVVHAVAITWSAPLQWALGLKGRAGGLGTVNWPRLLNMLHDALDGGGHHAAAKRVLRCNQAQCSSPKNNRSKNKTASTIQCSHQHDAPQGGTPHTTATLTPHTALCTLHRYKKTHTTDTLWSADHCMAQWQTQTLRVLTAAAPRWAMVPSAACTSSSPPDGGAAGSRPAHPPARHGHAVALP